ncbi:hypothetical protein [Mucisphaera calidilacus]|nr:hypothetical protein [Mucisphaera calidilacus]
MTRAKAVALSFLAILTLVLFGTAARAEGAIPFPEDLVLEAARDMQRPHEAVPSGTAALDWHAGPRLAWGEHPPDHWRAITFWGQVYEAEGGNPSGNSRVQIRDLRLAVKSLSDGRWHLLQDTSGFEGAFFREDFTDNDSWDAWLHAEQEGASVRLPNGQGRNFHFWPDVDRATFALADIDEVMVSVDARLIVHDPSGPDDRDQARLMMSVGADYWLSQTAVWDGWKTNGDVGIGRFAFIGRDWQTYTMTTLTVAEARDEFPVPEPGAASLVAICLGTLWCRRKGGCS